MIKKYIFVVLFFIGIWANAQITLEQPNHVRNLNDTLLSSKLKNHLDKLFVKLGANASLEKYISPKYEELTKASFNIIRDFHHQFKNDSLRQIKHQLINTYPIDSNIFGLRLHGILMSNEKSPIVLYDIRLTAEYTKQSFNFSVPLEHETKFWKTTQVGAITYRYQDTLNIKRAQNFDSKNKNIALNFGLKPDSLTLFMTNNYQDILRLRGVLYNVNDNGLYRDGYGVVDKTIFSVMGNEDFSHDTVHHYSGKVNKRENRNWITEEGLAYYWGNAYYTNSKGDMINYTQLKKALKTYLLKHPKTDIYDLFNNNTQIFQSFAPEVSSRSVIVAVIVEDIETKRGMKGIQRLINAGRTERLKNFMNVVEDLIGLTKTNFDKKVRNLL